MAGLMAVLGGAMQGLGTGMRERALALREERMAELREQRDDARLKTQQEFTAGQNDLNRQASAEDNRLTREANAAERQADRESAERLAALRDDPKPTFRPMSSDEKIAAGIDPKVPAQIDSNGKIDQIGGGGTTINMGGGSDKQIFDAMAESATSARSAANGLKSIAEARRAVDEGGFFGAGADIKLQLAKVGQLLGFDNAEAIQNTEAFRSAIAPQVAALMKATVGSTQISNADREFAEKAAGGSINLDAGSIKRLLDIMERSSMAAIDLHNEKLESVYPSAGDDFKRERALFSVAAPTITSEPTGRPRATNPQTGETVEFDGTNWVPAR